MIVTAAHMFLYGTTILTACLAVTTLPKSRLLKMYLRRRRQSP
jgi:hypothetical protein